LDFASGTSGSNGGRRDEFHLVVVVDLQGAKARTGIDDGAHVDASRAIAWSFDLAENEQSWGPTPPIRPRCPKQECCLRNVLLARKRGTARKAESLCKHSQGLGCDSQARQCAAPLPGDARNKAAPAERAGPS